MSRILLLILLILVFAIGAHADTIWVPDDYGAIQEAILYASKHDTVIVRPGTYVENINFLGKAITVKSDQGPDLTVIDGNWNGMPVVAFKNGEGPNSVIEGFYITNGYGHLAGHGGGISCSSSSPRIINNIISENRVGVGGGICCYDSSAMIINNTISHNIGTNTSGGIYLNSCSIDIINNTIYNNGANFGGAIGISNNSNINIVNSIFWDNKANYGKEINMGGSPNPSTLNISYSNIKGGKSSIRVILGCTLNWGSGMIDSDPLFFDPVNSDFHLQQDPCQPGIINPCVDSGDPAFPIIDGSTRTDNIQDTGIVDMGYHYPAKILYDFLNADTYTLSEATGGTVNFYLTAGAGNAKRTYILLGSISGTEPGNMLPGGHVTLPLNWDLFTNLIIDYMNSLFFMNFLGILDTAGNGAAIFNTLGPMPSGMAGITFSFAYAMSKPWDFVSNPINVEVVQ